MMSNTERRVVRGAFSGIHADPSIRSALDDALSVLGVDNREAVLYIMEKRYHIDLDNPGSKDEVFSALDDLFGVASSIIKKRLDAHIRLVSMSSRVFAP